MDRKYNDMYSLFRHDPSAEQYFDSLPGYVQEQLGSMYKRVDSRDRMECYVNKIASSSS